MKNLKRRAPNCEYNELGTKATMNISKGIGNEAKNVRGRFTTKCTNPFKSWTGTKTVISGVRATAGSAKFVLGSQEEGWQKEREKTISRKGKKGYQGDDTEAHRVGVKRVAVKRH